MNYNKKYLKYKKKYLDLKNNFYQTGGVRTAQIPQYLFLFRSAPVICNYNTEELIKANVKKCGDTHKTGIYLADNILVSIAMCLEYNTLLEIGVFVTTEAFKVSRGKYEFRELNRQKYFNGTQLIPFQEVSEEENISHVFPIGNLLKQNSEGRKEIIKLPHETQFKIARRKGFDEIFLTKDDIKKILLVRQYRFNPIIIKNASDLEEYLKANKYPLDIEKYIEDGILVEFDCPE